MEFKGNTVLITGGASGIGLALAKRFLQAGNRVIVCGRREEKLAEAKEKFPELHTRVCDVSNESDRRSLFDWVTGEFPDLNVLVNNAGIQQRVNLLNDTHDWNHHRQEITINVDAPIHLSLLFIPHLLKQKRAAIINVSSGLSITPGVWVPIYSATKAALHSFTMSLRIQLEDTNIQVVEILPPAVNTDLGGVGLHTFGAPLDDFADSVFNDMQKGELEIGYSGTEKRLQASMTEIPQLTKQAWEGFLQRNPDFRG
ncbi:SDR family NAD(P)-dependent oxidoreductase [Aneurinibacillus sp. Ricciae_BoGa-3]|uniref:SDR family oxidoreductase n=1 Tax=Aneurinibacillus sp. Ricciae_BoGa-3 TaxID=3022697 RepID=UPI0023427889|nr:SDR family NAD(P)-dependent oxidoreductase [Aneurinibacillus sp. Ricciae_BoGa-3]WCK52639.1 SDR family NAD(P)-dependent oxidoreductase [Aneurinibacillus sp. Ricciae_BoGa-3]